MDVKAHEKYNQGLSYFHDGRYQEAIASFKQAIRIEPDDAKAHYNLGRAYHSLPRMLRCIIIWLWFINT
jgi:tetratricopeptide (TPR) repeat protein